MLSVNPHGYDVIIVGAGLSGAVFAERAANVLDLSVLVVEKRSHIAGNCYDFENHAGVLVHQYGPHIFHTSNNAVWTYLSKFTEWHDYHHEVVADIDGALVPIPFNLNSIDLCFDAETAAKIEQMLVAHYGREKRVPILELMKAPSSELSALGQFVYDNVFLNYTTKQWGCKPEDISPEVTARVPVVVSRRNGYFNDLHQALPSKGYTALVANLLRHKNITVICDADFDDMGELKDGRIVIDDKDYSGWLIYTGALDSLFGYQYGPLPYRSLQFEFEEHDTSEFQKTAVVNYPNQHQFTRITEFKHFYHLNVNSTTTVKEFPQDYEPLVKQNIPYYPMFNDQSKAHFESYRSLASAYKQLITLGRLAEYKYFDMDAAVSSALEKFGDFEARYRC